MAGGPVGLMSQRPAQPGLLARKPSTGWLDRIVDYWPQSGVKRVFVDPVVSALTLPGDVYRSDVASYAVDPQTGEVATSPEMLERAADLAGTLTLGAGAIPAEANALRMGIRAYHGSPHEFRDIDLDEGGGEAWLTTDRSTAEAFGKDRMGLAPPGSSYFNATKWREAKPHVYEYEVDEASLKSIDLMEEATNIAEQIGAEPPSNWEEASEILQWARAQRVFIDEARQEGFGGLLFRNVGDSPNQAISDHIVVWDPNLMGRR